MDIDVLILGRVYSDLIFTGATTPPPGGEVRAAGFTISPGGAANRAIAAARLGAGTALVSEVGSDPIGLLIIDLLRAEASLDLTHLVSRAGFHSPVSVAITDGPDRSFVTYEEASQDPVWRGAQPKTIHVSLQSPLPGWVRDARAKGSMVFGGVGWDATGSWSEDVLKRLMDVDAVIVNEDEACAYTRTSSPERAAAILGQHIDLAVVTLGRSGVIAVEGGHLTQVSSIPVQALDPTGAGDTFTAAFMTATAWGWNLEPSLRLATASAACSVRGPGGARSAPYPADILDLMDQAEPTSEWAQACSLLVERHDAGVRADAGRQI